MEYYQYYQELLRPINFETMKASFNDAFQDDYHIVEHPETPINSPFNSPNEEGAHGRQYNLTLIPDRMDEKDFRREISDPNGIIVYYGCMDKDAAMPAYIKLLEKFPNKKIIYITVAGGVVQKEKNRKIALTNISEYIAQNSESVEMVIGSDHDHTCGKVKKDLGGSSLSDFLNITKPKEGIYAPSAEQAMMKSLIKAGSNEIGLPQLFGNKFRPALVSIDRAGGAKFDMNFGFVSPKSINGIAGNG